MNCYTLPETAARLLVLSARGRDGGKSATISAEAARILDAWSAETLQIPEVAVTPPPRRVQVTAWVRPTTSVRLYSLAVLGSGKGKIRALSAVASEVLDRWYLGTQANKESQLRESIDAGEAQQTEERAGEAAST